jgi:hypothetical protein
MNEKLLERKLKKEVERSGGLAIKIASPWFTGLPDRLVLMPGRMFYWVETKSTGKFLRPRQKVVRRLFTKLDIEVDVIDTEETLAEFLNKIRK